MSACLRCVGGSSLSVWRFNEIHPHFFNWRTLRRTACGFQSQINAFELFSWMSSFSLSSKCGRNEAFSLPLSLQANTISVQFCHVPNKHLQEVQTQRESLQNAVELFIFFNHLVKAHFRKANSNWMFTNVILFHPYVKFKNKIL